MYLIGFPLLVIPFAIYNMIAFLTPGLSWTDKVATIHLISGQDWTVTPEEILLAFSILLLGVEVIKAARMGIRGLMDHILSHDPVHRHAGRVPAGRAGRNLDLLHPDGDLARRRAGGLHHHRAHGAARHPDRPRPTRRSVSSPNPVP